MKKGIQEIQKVMVKELEVKYHRPPIGTMVRVTCSRDSEQLFRGVFNQDQLDLREEFWIALLNRANFVLGVSRIGIGSISACSVSIQMIFQLALNSNSSGILLCHNHPSGQLKPSQADISLTNKIKEGSKILDLSLLDHLIITSESYYSLCDEGVL